MKQVALLVMVPSVLATYGCSVTSTPIKQAEVDVVANALASDYVKSANQSVLKLDLNGAIKRALTKNLDLRVQGLEKSLAVGRARLAGHDILPSLTMDGFYNARNNDAGGVARILSTGAKTASAATSQDRQEFFGDFTLSWHILDFGLSYIRAKQMADRAQIARERERKAEQQIVQRVKNLYWQVIAAQQFDKKHNALRADISEALKTARILRSRGKVAPLFALSQERELLTFQRELSDLSDGFASACAELRQLLAISPLQKIELESENESQVHTKVHLADLGIAIEEAFRKRPEIREHLYSARIGKAENKARLLELLPGISLDFSANGDGSALLANNNWVGLGSQVSFNLIKLFSAAARRDVAGKSNELEAMQLKALAATIAAQVHMSHLQVSRRKVKLAIAQDFERVQRAVNKQTTIGAKQGALSGHAKIREEMATLVAELRLLKAQAELAAAVALYETSIGKAPLSLELEKREAANG